MKLGDFGISAFGLSGHIERIGTEGYIAPEIYEEKAHGMAVDFWSLGIVMYRMMVGHFPFQSDRRRTVRMKTLEDDISYPAFLSSCSRNLLESVSVIII